MRIGPYVLWGIYGKDLICSERSEEENGIYELRKLDLETKEVTELDVSEYGFSHHMNDNVLLCNEKDGEGTRLVEFNLDTGEKTEIFEERALYLIWTQDVKAFLVLAPSEKEKDRVYQYTGEGECKLLYEGDCFVPLETGGNLVIGMTGQKWDRSVIKKEDFLAGKKNWIKLEETEE